jgi:hypothetical protein
VDLIRHDHHRVTKNRMLGHRAAVSMAQTVDILGQGPLTRSGKMDSEKPCGPRDPEAATI